MFRTPGILLVDPPSPPLNSKNLAYQFWHPIGWAPLTLRNWGSSSVQNFKEALLPTPWHFIYQHSRSLWLNGASYGKKVLYQFCLDLYGMTFIFYVIFCTMIFFFFLICGLTHNLNSTRPPPPQVGSNLDSDKILCNTPIFSSSKVPGSLWWSVPPKVVLNLWYL
jgi:hypothetical protein